jgi:hypothetical protein
LPQDDCLKAVPDYSLRITHVMQREWRRLIPLSLMPCTRGSARAPPSASAFSFRALIANPRKLFAKTSLPKVVVKKMSASFWPLVQDNFLNQPVHGFASLR